MNKLKGIGAVALLFGVIYGYAHESTYFSNTFDIKHLFFRGTAIGVLVGLACFFYYKKTATDGLERFQLGAFFIVLGMFVFPYLMISTNHVFVKNDPLSIKVLFQRTEPIRTNRFGISKGKLPEPDGFYTYFLKNSESDRIRSKQELFRGIESGSEVELPIVKGFWGFQFVVLD
jgi:hypothetical protein